MEDAQGAPNTIQGVNVTKVTNKSHIALVPLFTVQTFIYWITFKSDIWTLYTEEKISASVCMFDISAAHEEIEWISFERLISLNKTPKLEQRWNWEL